MAFWLWGSTDTLHSGALLQSCKFPIFSRASPTNNSRDLLEAAARHYLSGIIDAAWTRRGGGGVQQKDEKRFIKDPTVTLQNQKNGFLWNITTAFVWKPDSFPHTRIKSCQTYKTTLAPFGNYFCVVTLRAKWTRRAQRIESNKLLGTGEDESWCGLGLQPVAQGTSR